MEEEVQHVRNMLGLQISHFGPVLELMLSPHPHTQTSGTTEHAVKTGDAPASRSAPAAAGSPTLTCLTQRPAGSMSPRPAGITSTMSPSKPRGLYAPFWAASPGCAVAGIQRSARENRQSSVSRERRSRGRSEATERKDREEAAQIVEEIVEGVLGAAVDGGFAAQEAARGPQPELGYREQDLMVAQAVRDGADVEKQVQDESSTVDTPQEEQRAGSTTVDTLVQQREAAGVMYQGVTESQPVGPPFQTASASPPPLLPPPSASEPLSAHKSDTCSEPHDHAQAPPTYEDSSPRETTTEDTVVEGADTDKRSFGSAHESLDATVQRSLGPAHCDEGSAMVKEEEVVGNKVGNLGQRDSELEDMKIGGKVDMATAGEVSDLLLDGVATGEADVPTACEADSADGTEGQSRSGVGGEGEEDGQGEEPGRDVKVILATESENMEIGGVDQGYDAKGRRHAGAVRHDEEREEEEVVAMEEQNAPATPPTVTSTISIGHPALLPAHPTTTWELKAHDLLAAPGQLDAEATGAEREDDGRSSQPLVAPAAGSAAGTELSSPSVGAVHGMSSGDDDGATTASDGSGSNGMVSEMDVLPGGTVQPLSGAQVQQQSASAELVQAPGELRTEATNVHGDQDGADAYMASDDGHLVDPQAQSEHDTVTPQAVRSGRFMVHVSVSDSPPPLDGGAGVWSKLLSCHPPHMPPSAFACGQHDGDDGLQNGRVVYYQVEVQREGAGKAAVAVMRFSQLRAYHQTWCARGLIKGRLTHSFPSRKRSQWRSSHSPAFTAQRAADLQGYFCNILNPPPSSTTTLATHPATSTSRSTAQTSNTSSSKQRVEMRSSQDSSTVAQSPLFWAAFTQPESR